MKVSVIISVYNHFEWLCLILDALKMQTYKDFEIVIADDGSSPASVKELKEYIASNPELHIIHSWHEDMGWRKNMALNKAVRATSGSYLIFMDGDCIPHPQFVEDHVRLADKGRVVAGRRIDLPRKVSGEIERWGCLPVKYFSVISRMILKELFRLNKDAFKSLKRMIHFPISRKMVAGMKKGGILGCNFSLYLEDLKRVNGFDERYVHPGIGEDTDLDLRLCNAGVEVYKVSRAALMLHRNHSRLPMDSEENQAILSRHRAEKATWTSTGLSNINRW